MSDLVGKAFGFAFRAHAGHVDKSGEVYATHLVRVASMLEGEEAQAVALLHDTVEDTDATEADIRAAFPGPVADAVMALTKRKNEPLEAYIARVAEIPLAARVKRADIADNSAPARMARLDPETQARISDKYSRALALLEEAGR